MGKDMKKRGAADSTLTAFQADLLRVALLAILAGLIWCTFYDRWSAESWQTPITYLSDPQKGDVIGFLAQYKATSEGHVWPFLFTNVPELGAPHVANWDDFPISEKPIFLLVGLLVKIFGLFAGANLALMLGQIFAAVSFYAACRMLNAFWVWAFAGALVFAFARYVFAQGLHHLPVTYYWHIPLCLVVCEWAFRGRGIEFRTWQFKFAVLIAVVTGTQNPYYMNMFAQLVLLAGVLQAWRHGWRAALPALSIVASAAIAFFLMNVNMQIHSLVYGPNSGAVVRSYHWLEIYGMKLVDLVMPPPDHPFFLFADWATQHLKEIVLSPGEMPPSAYLGLLGLAATGLLVVNSLRRLADGGRIPLEAWIVLWIILYAEVGGLNSIGGVLGVQLFRASTRYSIFILCVVLMYGVRYLSATDWARKNWAYGLAILLTLCALWDQTPPLVTDTELKETEAQVDSDRQFTQKIEQRLPAGAMVFQVPIMEFPESPVPNVGSYDHFRPYLYSHHLRFSFGSDKGRPQDKWQQALSQLPFDAAVSRLESYGFSAVYVNLNGFQDHGDSLVKKLKDTGHDEMITSDKGDLLCVILRPSEKPIMPEAY